MHKNLPSEVASLSSYVILQLISKAPDLYKKIIASLEPSLQSEMQQVVDTASKQHAVQESVNQI